MNATTTPETTALTVPEAAQAVRIADETLAIAKEYSIDSQPMYEAAGEELRDIATKIKKLEETRLSLTRPLDESKRRIMDLFRGPLTTLEQAQGLLKSGMATFHAAEQDRIRREREAAEAAARAERERLAREQAEAQAAAARAAEEAAAAAAAGDHEAAAAAEAAAAEAAEAAEAAQAEAELAEIAPPPAVLAEAPKAAGISARKNWKADVTDLAALVKAAAAAPSLLVYLQANTVTINQVAKALKAECRIPGVRVYAEDIIAARGR